MLLQEHAEHCFYTGATWLLFAWLARFLDLPGSNASSKASVTTTAAAALLRASEIFICDTTSSCVNMPEPSTSSLSNWRTAAATSLAFTLSSLRSMSSTNSDLVQKPLPCSGQPHTGYARGAAQAYDWEGSPMTP